MTNLKTTIKFSPVDMEKRKKLDIKPGDKIRVWQKVKEKDKIRLQAFEGMVIARKSGNEPGAMITVRAVFDGIGVERIFPLFSPAIGKIEIIARSKVRRAKLYYIRRKAAKEIKKRMKSVRVKGKIEASEEEDKAKKEEDKEKEADKKTGEEKKDEKVEKKKEVKSEKKEVGKKAEEKKETKAEEKSEKTGKEFEKKVEETEK